MMIRRALEKRARKLLVTRPLRLRPYRQLLLANPFLLILSRISRISIGSIRVAARIFYSDTFASRLEALSRVDTRGNGRGRESRSRCAVTGKRDGCPGCSRIA